MDLLLVVSLLGFFATSILMDRLAALDRVSPAATDPLARALWTYGHRYDPLVAANPLFLQVMSWISAFVFGPFYLVLVYALIRRRNWIRMPAIVYGSCMLYSMVVHVAVELLWSRPPPNTAVFFAVYLAYAIVPVLLLIRVRHPRPFG